jgi:hypothetical protein
MPAWIPKMPSYRPAAGCVSRCEPAKMGATSFLRPGLTAKVLPISSTVTEQPRDLVVSTNQSRACLSVSESARRDMPVSVGPLQVVRCVAASRQQASDGSSRVVWVREDLPSPSQTSTKLAGVVKGLHQPRPVDLDSSQVRLFHVGRFNPPRP